MKFLLFLLLLMTISVPSYSTELETITKDDTDGTDVSNEPEKLNTEKGHNIDGGNSSESKEGEIFTFNMNADFVSRYVWRGIAFGNSPALQPGFLFSAYHVNFGGWGSYNFDDSDKTLNESDLFICYSYENDKVGIFSAFLTDYYYPDMHADDPTLKTPDFFDWDNHGNGAHTIEGSFLYNAPAFIPISLIFAYNFYGDKDKSYYGEISYLFRLEPFDLSLIAGGAKGKSIFYSNSEDSFRIINSSLKASREILINESVKMPVSISYVLNPTLKKTMLVFSTGLSF